MFTFSFSSAFADTGLTAAEKDALNIAYSNVSVGAYSINYDNAYNNRTSEYYTNLPDLTVFSISAANMQKAVDEAYTDAIKTGTLPEGASVDSSYDVNDSNRANSVSVATIKAALVKEAQTTYLATAEKAAFDEYKAQLKGYVDSIDLSAYTTTKQDTDYTAADGEKYDNAAAAAAADKAYLLALIDKASFEKDADEAASSTKTWKTTYENLYKKLFEGTVADVKENKDDVLDANLITSISYVLKGNYATTKSEAADNANSAAAKATALAKLTQAVTNYQNSDAYSSKQDAGINAYVEAQKYLIENDKLTGNEVYTINAVAKANDGDYTVNGVDYVDRCAIAAKVIAAQETAKSDAKILGKYYDETAAAKALKEKLVKTYNGTNTDTAAAYTGDGTLTAGTKAAAKIDLSKVDAEGDIAEYYAYNKKDYYAKEWDAVKAAVDTYNAAVTAATTQKDIDDAKDALAKAVAKISDKATVDTAVSTSTTSATLTQLEQYFALTKSTYNTANNNSEDIYVNWGNDWDKTLDKADVVKWFIAQGARSAKEAAALYNDATKVINDFKAYSVAKTEANAVKAQIAALPTNIALADKAAVMAAYDAYKALPADVQIYVSNDATLKDAISKVYGLERNAVVTSINGLPAVSKVTKDNKDAIKAVLEAYDAYNETKAYGDNAFTGLTKYQWSNYDAYKNAVKAADLEAIQDMYNPLATKYSVDALTAADAEAVAKLQAAIAEYIADYNETPSVAIEKTTEQMASVIASLTQNTVETLKITAKSTAKKGSITVSWTVKGDAKAADGYRIYRSTKKNSGFGTRPLFTTTKQTYKNTKNLKKGTRYYYKVRAYKVVDGKTYFSDWSNKAIRIAK